METLNLDLRRPLLYQKDGTLIPFSPLPPGEERVFCFRIAAGQAVTIEPDPCSWLGELLFAGKSRAGEGPQAAGAETLAIPAGLYVFCQSRDAEGLALSGEDFVFMGIELQKDGLWERHKLEDTVFFRQLWEDGALVTQVLRPCEGSA